MKGLRISLIVFSIVVFASPFVYADEVSQSPQIETIEGYRSQPQVVRSGEQLSVVEVSLKDISRVVCYADIEQVIYSKEKGLEIKQTGREAFIKNLPQEWQEPLSGISRLEYDSRPKELFIVCGGETFSLLLTPKDIPTQTIYLRSDRIDKRRADEYERVSDYETTLLTLIRDTYLERIPDGYEVEEVNKLYRDYKEISLVYRRKLTGNRYLLYEFVAIAKTEVNLNEMAILEAIGPKKPLAISIVNPYLRAGEQSRVFIVRLI